MKEEYVSVFLGACYEAKRIVELMPKLPQGMKPSQIHVLDIIYRLQQAGGTVRISDIGAALHVTNPSITRLVNELVELQAVEKVQSKEDRRVFMVGLTDLGLAYQKKYLDEYHQQVAERMAGVPEKDIQTMARVVHQAYCLLSDGNVKRN